MTQPDASGMLGLRFLGSPQMDLDGGPVEVDTRKAIALIAYLAVTGQSHSREALATLLWPEYGQERAYANLRRTLWALNKVLGKEWLDADRDMIGMAENTDVWMDVDEFRRQLAECRAHGHPDTEVCSACLAPLARAAALYRDDFLAGFTLLDSAAFDEWQFFEAESLRRELASGLERLVSGYSAAGDLGQAIDYARRWLALDPLHEPAHRHLMILYAREGRRAAALRQYEECVRVLDEELGVPPGEETTELYEAIQRDELPPARFGVALAAKGLVETAPALTHNLPPQPTPFVGRADELAEIDALLGDPDCRLLTLVGPGGVGKTRLALEAALQAAEQAQSPFSHGVYSVPLVAVESARFLVPTIAAVLGFSFFQREGVEPKQQLLDYLREKEMLLLLDNFEQLMDGAELLAEVLSEAPGVKLLVTSRERLHLRSEWVFDVKGMRFPWDGDEAIEVLADYSAVTLFLQRAGQADASFTPAEDDWPALVRICQLVEGMPLGIEMAATWVRMLSCREIAGQLEQGLDFLSTTLRDVPDRHRSLRTVVDHSWQLLSETERSALAQLSVFRGGFGREAAQQVAGASLSLLASLADKSLLQRDPSGRYGMHEAVRQYAADKLGRAPQLDEVSYDEAAARDRHSHYYTTFLAQRTDDLRGPRQIEVLAEVAQEIENVRAAWRWAIKRVKVEEIRRAAISLSTFFQVRSLGQEGEEACRQAAAALEAAREQGPTDEIDRTLGLLLAYRGEFAYWLYKEEGSQALLERSLALLRPLGRGVELALANILGVWVGVVEDVAEGEQRCQQSLDYFRSVGRAWGIGMALESLGWLARLRGDVVAAKKYLEETAAVLKQAGDRWGLALAFFDLGILAQDQMGERADAKHYYEDSLRIRRELGDRWGMALCLDFIGYLAREMGEYDTSRKFHDESLSISREVGDQLGVAGSLDNLGLVARDVGHVEEAGRYFREGLALRREVGELWSVAVSLRHVGDTALGLGDLTGAEQWYRDSLQSFQNATVSHSIEITLARLGEVALERGDVDGSGEHLRDALRTCVEYGNLSYGPRILVGVAEVLARTNRGEMAAGLLAYVQGHPASTTQARERAERLLGGLAAASPAVSVKTARERFRGGTLEAVVEWALAEL